MHSQKNVLPSIISLSKPKQLVSLEKKTLVAGDMRSPNVSTPVALVFTPSSTLFSTNALFKQFIKAYLETQTSALI